MANTKEQRAKREAFVHQHKEKFAELTKGQPYRAAHTNPAVAEFIQDVARPALGYSSGTDPDSIWFTLHSAFRKLYPNGVPQAPAS